MVDEDRPSNILVSRIYASQILRRFMEIATSAELLNLVNAPSTRAVYIFILLPIRESVR